jgi:hypothetical protein
MSKSTIFPALMIRPKNLARMSRKHPMRHAATHGATPQRLGEVPAP